MANEWSIGGPDRRSSTDVDHAVGTADNHVCRLLSRAHRDDGAVLVGKHLIGAGEKRWRQIEAERLAVLTLTINSNFVGCSIGRSTALAPFAILSTYSAARLNMAEKLAP